MSSFNKITVVGYLGRAPELRYTPDGTPVSNFSVATTERRKDKSGEIQETTPWFQVALFGRRAEVANEYLSKGSHVWLEGPLTRNSGPPGRFARVNLAVIASYSNSGFSPESHSRSRRSGRTPRLRRFDDRQPWAMSCTALGSGPICAGPLLAQPLPPRAHAGPRTRTDSAPLRTRR